MTIREARINFRDSLSDIYPTEEISAFEKIVFQELLKVSSAELVLINDKNITPDIESELEEIISQLKREIPIQYIFRYTEFYGLKFTVNKNVLIPRPETEELVDWIIKENSPNDDLKILDIGTGSGCIISSLAMNLPNAKCFATDISEKAISIARKNAKENNTKVSFSINDILSTEINPFQTKYDIIVSNPPYVMESEKIKMQKNVLDYEPGLALFVDDDDALIFYSTIASKAKKWLKPGGKLYFEINEQKGPKMHELLATLGYKNIELKRDLNSKDRMIRGTL